MDGRPDNASRSSMGALLRASVPGFFWNRLLLIVLLLGSSGWGSTAAFTGRGCTRCRSRTSSCPSSRPGVPFTATTKTAPRSAPITPPTRMLAMWSRNEELEGSDRIKACVPYILPLLDGDQFGHYIYQRIPPLGALNDFFIGPLVSLYHHIPFLGLALFIMLTLGTRFNTNMHRNVRFSAQQACLIDVALIFPELIASPFVEQAQAATVAGPPPLPVSIVEPCNNFVWYAYMAAVVYSVYSNMRGKKPDQIPLISNAADLMVGPF